MRRRRREPRWLSRRDVEAMHHEQLLEHGGLPGIRDENLPESALARPRNRFHYEPASDIASLAAAYAYGLAKNHPFADGNKRIAFVAAAVFAAINGREIEAPEPEVVVTIRRVAAGHGSEEELAAWLRRHLRTRKRRTGGPTN